MLIDALRDRAKTMKEFALLAQNIIEAPTAYDETAVAKFLSKEALEILEAYKESLHVNGVLNHMRLSLKHPLKPF